MPEKKVAIADPKRQSGLKTRTRTILFLTVFYQVLAIIIFGLVAIYALEWLRTPFVGALVENTLVVNAIGPTQEGSWHAKNAGVTFRDRIVAIDGQGVLDIQGYLETLRQYDVLDEVSLTVSSARGGTQNIQIVLQEFPLADKITLVVFPYVIGLIFLVCGLWVLSLRRADASGRAFSRFTASVAISVASLLDISTTNHLTYVWTFSITMIAGSLIHFALIYPQESRVLTRRPHLNWAGYALGILLTILAFPTLFNYQKPYSYILARSLEYIYLGFAALVFLSVTALRRFRSPSPVVRQQATVILWGAASSFLPLTGWFLIHTFGARDTPFSPYLLMPLALFPVSVAYAILRYQLIKTDYIFSRAVLYALLSTMAVAGYALLISGASLVLGNVILANNPIIVGLMIFILALLVNPVRTRLQGLVDRVFFRGQQVYQERIQNFSSALNPAMGLTDIANLLRGTIQESLTPSQLHVFVLDSLRDQYVATPGPKGHPTTDIRFGTNSSLPQVLSQEKSFLFLHGSREFLPALAPEKARITLLGAQLFHPLPGRTEQVIGFISLAPRSSSEPYTNQDLNFLAELCGQAAVAIERAQVVADLERRVNEMNVLIRIAQGINITLQFDDILELIYAQATRIVPSRDFWILLFDAENKHYSYAFYLEDDMRLLQHEQHPLIGESDLALEVIRSGQTIITDDLEREARENGIVPQVKGLYAWVGVPLNAAAETIGAMSLGNRDPSVVYSSDQVEFLQAISDQAAGAIVKARLLEESQRSARQLTLLNEVARNLTSTLELSLLLDQILENAIDIIGCEAGTLFLVDDETGELIFEVVKGPVAQELQGKRLPPGTGHVGRAVETGEAAIVNEVRQTAEWSRRPDQQTGFQTRDLLLVPLFAQERVIGVIEVINRQDGLPFNTEDQEFLLAFSSQAAVALENARLYTLTDQQLAERVDELSVMQRIDRDLNTSLDIDRAMRITLDWAMRRSGADAGLVGAVTNEGLRVMADQGYAHELDSFRDSFLPVELPGIKSAVEDEKTQKLRRSEMGSQKVESFTLLEGAQNQIVIPIRREERVIGLLILESDRDDPWTEEIQAFLSRLTDHAAIAIANAQLFLQVQEADLAKTEFISFVSHELKTPMTSIRGYTDLLLAGAVGVINDPQENFLNTIKTNVNRMATLVSDLADVSRIESGRLRLEFTALEINSVVDEVVRSQATGVNEKEQTLELQIPEDLAPVWGDRNRIVQVLTNLVSNAYKYTPKGGTITILAEETENRWDPEGAVVVNLVTVRDTGIGMTAEDQEQVFTKFFRSPDPKAREAPGTGLGLNITRYLVEMQGGKIWFESDYGVGTAFYFTVPIAEE